MAKLTPVTSIQGLESGVTQSQAKNRVPTYWGKWWGGLARLSAHKRFFGLFACGILMGRVWSWYSSRGIMFIFIMLHLPNQENRPVCHFCKSFLMILRRGGKLREKISSVLLSSRMPKYLMWEPAQRKRKSARSRLSRDVGTETFKASDFWKLTMKKDSVPYLCTSDNKFGTETRGLDIKNNKLSAKAAILGARESLRWIPDMLGLSLTVRRNGSYIQPFN